MCVSAAVANTVNYSLLLRYSHSSDSGEMSNIRERKFCKNWVLLSDRCRRLQYSLEKQRSELIRLFHLLTDRNTRGRRDGSHLGARNTCPEDSKELGSNDCISVTRGSDVSFFILSLNLNKHRTLKALPLYSHWSCSITSLRSAWM